jgi:glycosidase
MALSSHIPDTDQVQRAWWKEASVYQIYPSSFKDSNGDGFGDLGGIIEKLDYIKALGVDVVWCCPIYKSPQVDMGYDISDYKDIDARYGTMEDVDHLISGLHQRGLKFLMDLVVNHTSDQHEWFQQSRSSKHNTYRDWYIWRDPKLDSKGNRQPPNNWSSYFGGSAWESDEPSGQYYLHLFDKTQPDLNWECDEMRSAIYETVRWWLDKGVDGFRLDVINLISKDQSFPDATVSNPNQAYHHGSEHYANGPRIHEFLQELGGILHEYNAFSVGEMPWVSDPEEILKCVGYDRKELNMIFNFDMVDMDHGPGGKFSPKEWQMTDLKDIVSKWQSFMYGNGGWNALYLENHDQPRTVSRWASDSTEHRTLAAKMFATFLGLQSGTVFIYQGQELGMSNIPEHWNMDEFRDLETLNHWNKLCEVRPNDKKLQSITKQQYHIKSRDNARTPMQWTADRHAGFTTGEPWFRVNDTYDACNAEAQVGVRGSSFEYWRSILGLRKQMLDVFVYGDFQMVDTEHEDVFAYERTFKGQSVLVVCNFRQHTVDWILPVGSNAKDQLISNYNGVEAHESLVKLRPFEAFAIAQGKSVSLPRL